MQKQINLIENRAKVQLLILENTQNQVENNGQ